MDPQMDIHTEDVIAWSSVWSHTGWDLPPNDEVSARCQYNVTGWVSMWAYDMLSQ